MPMGFTITGFSNGYARGKTIRRRESEVAFKFSDGCRIANLLLAAGTQMTTSETFPIAASISLAMDSGPPPRLSDSAFPLRSGTLQRQRFPSTGYRVCSRILDRDTLVKVKAFLE